MSDLVRNVVFRLSTEIDPAAKQQLEEFARMRQAAMGSPTVGPSAAPSGGLPTAGKGYVSGTMPSTGSYAEDLRRLKEAEKSAADYVKGLRIEAARAVGEAQRNMLAGAAEFEKRAAEQIQQQRLRYEKENEERRTKSWRAELKYQEMIRVEREKTARIEERERVAQQRAQDRLFAQRDRELRKTERNQSLMLQAGGQAAMYGLRGATYLASIGGASDTVMNSLLAVEGGISLAQGAGQIIGMGARAGVPAAIAAKAFGVKAGGAAIAAAPYALAAGGVLAGGNAAYELATGNQNGVNGFIARNLGFNYLANRALGIGTESDQQRRFIESKAAADADLNAQREIRRQQDVAYAQSSLVAQQNTQMRDYNRATAIMGFEGLAAQQAFAANMGVNRSLRNFGSGLGAAQNAQYAAAINAINTPANALLANRRADLAESVAMTDAGGMTEQAMSQEIQKQVNLRREIGLLTAQQLRDTAAATEQIRQQRLLEAETIRNQGADAKEQFGMLSRGEQARIVRARERLVNGGQVSNADERLLQQFADPQAQQILRDRRNQRADAGGFGAFEQGFADAARKREELAKELEMQRDKDVEALRKSAKESGEVLGKALQDVFPLLLEEAIKAINAKAAAGQAANAPLG